MKKLLSFLTILFIVFVGLILSAEVVELPGFLGKPTSINLDDQRIYITDGATIFIYSLKDFKLIKKFGRKGEGPGEFILSPGINRIGLRLSVDGENIIVHHLYHVSFFTKEGKFQRQEKIPDKMEMQLFRNFGDKYVGFYDERQKNQISLNLYSPKTLEREKELFRRTRRPILEGKIIDTLQFAIILKDDSRRGIIYQPYKDKLVVEGEKDVIHILDNTGKELHRIPFHDYEKIELTKDFEKEVFKWLEKRMKSGTGWIKQSGAFPSYLPYRFFHVDEGNIYVLTFEGSKAVETKQQNPGKHCFFIFDMQGKLLKKVWIPFHDNEFLYAYPYTIKNGKIYQLVENEDSGDWELNIQEI